MKCTVGAANLGVWCRSIHSLAQVGDEDIYLDCSDTILTVSTFNSSMSNYATFLFFRNFFSSYQMTSDEPEKMVIPAKIMLKPYRTLRVAKNYLSSEINYNPSEDFLLVTSEGKSHVSTTYRLGASVSNDDIQYECDPYALKSFLKSDAKVLSSCLSNFTHMKGLSELTLKIQGQKVTLKNVVTDVSRKDGSVVTEYNLTAHDFIDYEIEDDNVELCFGFREFKVFVGFAEQLKLPVSIHFQGPAEPVIVTVKTDTFDARLCMATRIRDPFSAAGIVSQLTTGGGSNGGISNVTSQTSSRNNVPSQSSSRNNIPSPSSSRNNVPSQSSSRNNVTHEINRGQDNADSDAAVHPFDSDLNDPLGPPAKRARRTDFEVLAAIEPEPRSSRSDVITIAPLIEQAERRQKSKLYKALIRTVNTPRLTDEEYLRTLPGNDVVLCPDSDEET